LSNEEDRWGELPTLYQQQIHRSKYSRWREDEGRRETWPETVDRYLDQMERQAGKHGTTLGDVRDELREAIMAAPHEPGGALGSMRAVMTAGAALERDNVAGYNCAYLAVNRPQAFDEALYILACGTGVGFSVERKYVGQLPEVPRLYESDTTIVVRDSKIGWASALRQLIHLLYSGVIPKRDTSRVRPAGSRLKTFGGRASGPEPLEELFQYVIDVFRAAQGRKLYTIECHGIMCKVGAVIVSGGVRRSALISLSDADDDRMRDAKSGQWWVEHPEYRLANNSAVWEERPPVARFMEEWASLIRSGSGERGIVNRAGMRKIAAANGRRDPDHEFGTNPCSEIILRDRQFCNLSEVIARHSDSLADLERKVRLATILGTIQSTFTDFRYLSAAWRKNCEEERLLGVSITGIMDHPILSDFGTDTKEQLEAIQEYLKAVAIRTNEEWAARLGISPSAAITCVKPSGTVSQLVDAASGIHPRWSRHYVRTNRGSKLDPVSNFLWAQGVPAEDDVMDDHNWVFSFPIEAPRTAVLRDQVTAIDQLKLWLKYAEHWCEHKPSITVYVREEEWLEVGAFVYRHFDRMSGVSFLPFSDHVYEQSPYQEIDAATFAVKASEMPMRLAWENLQLYESEDSTTGSQELACVAGNCDVP